MNTATEAPTLWIQESWVNATEGYCIGDSEVYETDITSRGALFRRCQSEYGRCVSQVYVDGPEKPRPVGWVFQQAAKYEDTDKPFERETWVTIHAAPPVRTVTYQYA